MLTIGGSFWLVVLMHREAEHFGVAVEAAAARPRQAFLQKAVDAPSRLKISRLRREMQIARLPVQTRSSASISTERTP